MHFIKGPVFRVRDCLLSASTRQISVVGMDPLPGPPFGNFITIVCLPVLIRRHQTVCNRQCLAACLKAVATSWGKRGAQMGLVAEHAGSNLIILVCRLCFIKVEDTGRPLWLKSSNKGEDWFKWLWYCSAHPFYVLATSVIGVPIASVADILTDVIIKSML